MDTQTETPQTLEPGTIRLAISGDRDALAAVTEVLRGSDTAARKALAAAVAPTDAIRLILRLKSKDAKRLLKALPDTPSLRVLNELDPALAGDLVDEGLRARLHKLVSRLHEDAAAEFLAGMPSSLRADLLNDLGNPAELLSRLDHADESAGAVMAHDAIYTTAERTIGEVIEQIRANSDRIRRIYAVYVVDERRHLIGALKMRDLLLNPDDCPVAEVMRPAPKAVTADRDRAEVVHEAEAAGLPVLPVVDGDGKLLGRITPEELREIDQAEADEDIKIMAGLRPDSSALDTPFQIVPRRLPWLAAGLVGAGIAALVVGAYEDALVQAAILASLIPIVMSLAGNAGIQASTVTVQAQTAGTFWIGDLWRRIVREIGGAALNGAVVGALVGTGILVIGATGGIDRAPALALAAALTLVLVTVQASAIGSLVPVVLERLGFDPAVATGVFITTSNDVIGVLLFFVIATAIYL